MSCLVYSQEKILGKWLPTDKLGQIEIYENNGKYYGKIVHIYDSINPKTNAPWKDELNPDKLKRQRNILGITMMFDFEYNKATKKFVNGSLYDVKTGKTFRGKMWLEKDMLFLRGYWLFFHKTEKWKKISISQPF